MRIIIGGLKCQDTGEFDQEFVRAQAVIDRLLELQVKEEIIAVLLFCGVRIQIKVDTKLEKARATFEGRYRLIGQEDFDELREEYKNDELLFGDEILGGKLMELR